MEFENVLYSISLVIGKVNGFGVLNVIVGLLNFWDLYLIIK